MLSAPRQKSGFQLEMVVNLEPGKEHKASTGGTPCGVWGTGKGHREGDVYFLATPPPGWGCVGYSQERSPWKLPRQG